MTKPANLPNHFTNWADVLPYDSNAGGYKVIRKADGLLFATFICESDAILFAELKNDVLKNGGGI